MLAVHCVYFTMTDIELNLPGNKKKYPPRNHVLATLNALPTNITSGNKDNQEQQQQQQQHFRYEIVNKGEKYVQIYPATGELMFNENFLNNCKFNC